MNKALLPPLFLSRQFPSLEGVLFEVHLLSFQSPITHTGADVYEYTWWHAMVCSAPACFCWQALSLSLKGSGTGRWLPALLRGGLWPGSPPCVHSGLSSMSSGQLCCHSSRCQGSWEGTNQWPGLAEGSRTWREKGFVLRPLKTGRSWPAGLTVFLSSLSKGENVFSSCQDPMGAWQVPWWPPEGLAPTPHLLLMAFAGVVPAKAWDLVTPGMCICSQVWMALLPGKEHLVPWPAPAGLLRIGWGEAGLMRKCHL